MDNDRLIDGSLKPKWDVLKQQLPHYQHQTKAVSLARLQQAMLNGESTCSFLLKSSERERFMWFSIPALVAYSQQLVITTTLFQQLGQPARLSVADVLNNPALRGVVQKDRRYGEHIDPLLAQNKAVIRDIVQPQESLLRLLAIGRADFTFNYPAFVRYWQKLNPALAHAITLVPIKDQAPFKPAFVVCSKTDWGKKVIADINASLQVARRTEPYRYSDDRFLDEAERQQLTQYYNRFIVEAL